MRFSLKLFLLLLVLAALLVAYSGIRSKTHALRISNYGQWQSFGGETAYRGDGNGGIYYDSSGKALSAEVRSAREFRLLLQKPSVTQQIQSIGIVGAETFQSFDADQFPNVEEVELAQVFGTSRPLSIIRQVNRLKRLRLAEHQISVAALNELVPVESLEHLHIFTNSEFPIEEFPELNQLSLLVIDAPMPSEEAQEKLRERFPRCEIVFRPH